jgi:hypothetical protein
MTETNPADSQHIDSTTPHSQADQQLPAPAAQVPLDEARVLQGLFDNEVFRRMLSETVSAAYATTASRATMALPETNREQPIVVTQTAPPDYSKMPLLDLDTPSTIYPWVYALENALKNSDVRVEEWRSHLLRAPQSSPTSQPTMELFASQKGEEVKEYLGLRNGLCLAYGPPTPRLSLLLSLNLRFPLMPTTQSWILECRLTRALVDLAAAVTNCELCSDEEITAVLISPFPPKQRVRLEKRVNELLKQPTKRLVLFDTLSRTLPEITPPLTQLAPVAFVEDKDTRPYMKRPRTSSSNKERPNKKYEGKWNNSRSGGRSCNWCGRDNCTSRATCPAKDSTCSKCSKVGHYGRVCRMGKETKSKGPDRIES